MVMMWGHLSIAYEVSIIVSIITVGFHKSHIVNSVMLILYCHMSTVYGVNTVSMIIVGFSSFIKQLHCI